MFSTGDIVIDQLKEEKVKIVERMEVWGFISYKVYNPSEDEIYKLAEDQIRPIEEKTGTYNENYIKYISLLGKIKNEVSTGILSSLASGIIPLPHQKYVLNRALRDNNIRYILADEVGLGKTIEAGLIIKELKARGIIKRILIVCPKGLVTQWNLEMSEKFNEKFHVILPEDHKTIRKLTENDDIYSEFDQVISPMDSIKPLEKRAGWTAERIEAHNRERIHSIVHSGWDLVVIDEAHRVAGSSGEVARHKLGRQLAFASPYLLLLTATPHNGKTEPFLRLIRLVDEDAFPNVKAIVKEQVAPYIIRTEKREAIDNKGKRLFKNRNTQVEEVEWDERHSMQSELYSRTTEYVTQSYNKAKRARGKNMWFIFLLIIMQRMVTSSTRAIRESLERRLEVLLKEDFRLNHLSEEDLYEMEFEENLDDVIQTDAMNVRNEAKELQEIVEIAKQAEFQYMDAKVEPFMNIVDELLGKNTNQKIIVFTEFVATQKYLSELLEKQGFTTSKLNGSMGIEERNKVLEDFKTESQLLISTDAGGEGLNLQFANVVINYDLPWNPMKIEQRIGRVDRIGQQQDVFIYNFILKDTVENRVKTVLEEKLSLILEESGIDKYSDVLDSEFSEMSFTDAYLKSLGNPKQVEFFLKPVEKDLKTQVKNAEKFRDVIHEEKDLKPLVGTESNFDVERALRKMVMYYENYKGRSYLPIDQLSINDPQIIRHLHQDFTRTKDEAIPVISIENFPNEEGYFSLWEISLADSNQAKRVIPVFITKEMILRPIAGQKIWETILKEEHPIGVNGEFDLKQELFQKIEDMAKEVSYDTFLEMKNAFEKKKEETYRKYLYALELRIDAARNIGIENIRNHKLLKLMREKEEVEKEYQTGLKVFPEFKPLLLIYLEG